MAGNNPILNRALQRFQDALDAWATIRNQVKTLQDQIEKMGLNIAIVLKGLQRNPQDDGAREQLRSLTDKLAALTSQLQVSAAKQVQAIANARIEERNWRAAQAKFS